MLERALFVTCCFMLWCVFVTALAVWLDGFAKRIHEKLPSRPPSVRSGNTRFQVYQGGGR